MLEVVVGVVVDQNHVVMLLLLMRLLFLIQPASATAVTVRRCPIMGWGKTQKNQGRIKEESKKNQI